AVLGLLALEMALNGASSEEASASGVAAWIADRPFGTPALWVVAASLLALALWRAGTAVNGDPVEEDDGVHRAAWGVQAVVYLGFALTFAAAARSGGSDSGSSGSSTQDSAGAVFEWPGGRWIVVLAGLAVIGFAIHLIVRHAVHASFAERLTCPEDSTVVTLGRVGYGLRSVAYVLVGGLLASAGLSGEEERAEGLSGALQRTAEAGWGRALLFAVALGFLAYGAYCVAEARYRRAA
ncbi:MAG TPA: DUF1206 domain-containing protein, partial [Nocardioides sp.]|nr:DUF1206 domain-containing protein [Nocardioides sp.]